MTNPAKPEMGDYEAMIVAMVTVDAFASLPFADMPTAMQAGALLQYETVMRRIKPMLPPTLTHVFDSIKVAETIAVKIRKMAGLAPVI